MKENGAQKKRSLRQVSDKILRKCPYEKTRQALINSSPSDHYNSKSPAPPELLP